MAQRVVLLTLAVTAAACRGDGTSADPDAGGDADAATPAPDAGPPEIDPIDPAVLHEIEIDIAPGDLASFDVDQQTRVPCDVRWDGELLAQSACRKKGNNGSVDAVTGKPAFSIKFDDLVAGQKLGPFDKMTLNNALQDPSLVHEHVAYEVFRRLGVPAHRTAFAVVTFNGEPRGIYLAVEPIDKEFLRARYGADNDEGNLYESPTVDFAVYPDGMELKDAEGRSRDDINAAAAAVNDAPDATFAADVGALIDLPEFYGHFAGELLLDAEDGHALGRNNYYLYHRPDTDRFVFLPHGHDVILGNPGQSPDYPPPALLAARVRAIPALSAEVDAVLAAAVAPGGALDDDELSARIDAALALVATTSRDDDFTAGDLATMAQQAPVVAAQLAWRAALIRGEVSFGECSDGVVQGLEQCDDGNLDAGDGCDAACFPECVAISGAGANWKLCPAARDRVTAIASCIASGGELLVPSSADEAATLALVVRRHLGNADVWLGVTDEAAEDTWLTDGGAPAPYLGFTGVEPSGGTSENCAVLDTGRLGAWRDQPCDVGYPALCRLP